MLIDHYAIRNTVIDVTDAKSCSNLVDWKHCDYDINYYILNQGESRDHTKVLRTLMDLALEFQVLELVM